MRTSLLLLLLPGALAAQQPPPDAPYRNPRRPVTERVRDLLTRMSPEEKFWQLFMIPGSLDDPSHDYRHGVFGLQVEPGGTATGPAAAREHAERINGVQRFFVEQTRLGIPMIPFEEALHGFVREGATVFPQAIALAAAFDTALMGRVAAAIAAETRSRGVRDVLSPVVNIATDVRWGRTEETWGEDPLLASLMGAAFVAPFERAGVITTPKHLVANVGEGGRDSYPIEVSERLLRELHYPPFEAALRAGARSVMTAYNSVDGDPATQSERLLRGTLKTAWGFTGFVISDAAATGGATVLHMTERTTPEAARHAWQSGLDVVFQSSWPQHRPYWEAVRTGLVPPDVLDSAVARVLRAKFELGLFERPYANADSAALLNGRAEHRALALEAARAGIVLLKNDGRLPMADGGSTRVAVIGVDAAEARLGGYSGPGTGRVSILDALRARLGDRVSYAPGPGRLARDVAVVPAEHLAADSSGTTVRGLRGEYFEGIALAGAPRVTRTDARVDFGWTFNGPARGVRNNWYSVRWTGRLTAPPAGVRRLGIEGSDGYRLWLDDQLVIDNWRKVSAGRRLADVTLEPGSVHQLRLEYFETTGNARVRLVWDAPDSSQAALDSAVAVARAADVTIVVAGIEEGEFRDRSSLRLPGRQEELITAVAATGKPVIVVLVGGSAVTMPWLDRVNAGLMAWYPGELGGPAVAEVLLGGANPAGRLPITFPIAEGQLPLRYNHKPTGRGDDYLDLTGQPLFPFGYGLSYTTFEYRDLRIVPATIAPGETARVRVRVRNAGARAGGEGVPLYVRDAIASVSCVTTARAGGSRVALAPGASADVEFTLGPAELQLLDRELRPVVEPGDFRVMVGASSRDIRVQGTLAVRAVSPR